MGYFAIAEEVSRSNTRFGPYVRLRRPAGDPVAGLPGEERDQPATVVSVLRGSMDNGYSLSRLVLLGLVYNSLSFLVIFYLSFDSIFSGKSNIGELRLHGFGQCSEDNQYGIGFNNDGSFLVVVVHLALE